MPEDPVRTVGDACVDEDVWGKICADFACGDGGRFVLLRDDGLAQELTPAPYFREEMSEAEERVLGFARGLVLDVGCGPGRHVLALQRRGLSVVGIDVSPGVVRLAMRRGCRDVRVMSLWDLDQVHERFDTVLMLGNNAGLPGSLGQVRRFLSLLAGCTTEGAVLIAQSVDPTDTDKPEHLAYHRRNEEAGRYKGEVRIRLQYGDRVSPWWDLVLMEQGMFRGCCEDAGWHVLEVVPDRPSYYLVAQKEGGLRPGFDASVSGP